MERKGVKFKGREKDRRVRVYREGGKERCLQRGGRKCLCVGREERGSEGIVCAEEEGLWRKRGGATKTSE